MLLIWYSARKTPHLRFQPRLWWNAASYTLLFCSFHFLSFKLLALYELNSYLANDALRLLSFCFKRWFLDPYCYSSTKNRRRDPQLKVSFEWTCCQMQYLNMEVSKSMSFLINNEIYCRLGMKCLPSHCTNLKFVISSIYQLLLFECFINRNLKPQILLRYEHRE